MPRARNIAGFFMGAATWAEASGGMNELGLPLSELVALPILPFFAAGIGRGRQGGHQDQPKEAGQRPSGRKRGEQN